MKYPPLLLCAFVALGCAFSAAPADEKPDAAQSNRQLGRGINFGNALEAPREGEWGLTLEEDFFERVKKAGFQSVRLPVRWSAHAGDQAPYTIDDAFFKRVDWAVEQALKRDLVAVLNVHHFDELDRDPDRYEPKLLALWKQIAQRYRTQPDRLYFELYNEPHDKLTDERWNKMVPKLLDVVRASNPERIVVVGPGQWNNLNNLAALSLPEKDRRLIGTFHYYNPFPFTHQAAEWVPDSKKWKGTKWTGTEKETEALRKDFEKAAAWSKKTDRPLFLGEFGAYSAADMESRALWTRAVAREAEKHGFSWAYWEFAAGFGAYDREAKAWRRPLLNALLDKEKEEGEK
jgi:endoglucanase